MQPTAAAAVIADQLLLMVKLSFYKINRIIFRQPLRLNKHEGIRYNLNVKIFISW